MQILKEIAPSKLKLKLCTSIFSLCSKTHCRKWRDAQESSSMTTAPKEFLPLFKLWTNQWSVLNT